MSCGPYSNDITLNINTPLTSFPASNIARIENVTFSEDIYFLGSTGDSTLVYKNVFVKIGKDGYISEVSTGSGSPSNSHTLRLYTRFSIPNYYVGTNRSYFTNNS